MDEWTRDAHVEPLFAALGKEEDVDRTNEKRAGSARRELLWKLFWAGLVLLGLVAVVLKQSF